MTTAKVRETEKILSSHRQLEGAGFIVRRPLPAPGLPALDPFLLIDEMGPWSTGRVKRSARPTTRTVASRP